MHKHAAVLNPVGDELGKELVWGSNTRPQAHKAQSTGSVLSLCLSVLAHVVLVGILAIGVRWNTTPPAPYEAVLWASLPSNSTSSPQEANTPNPPKLPPSQTKPTPPRKVEPAPKKPDIAIQKKPEPKKIEPKKTETQKAEPKKLEPKQAEKTPLKTPEAKPKDPAPNSDTLKKLREDELARALGGLPSTKSNGKTNGSASTGRSTAQYSDKIRQHVRSRIVFPGASSVDDNPQVVFEVRQLPTGEIVGITQKQSSGNGAWDTAVERALQRSSPLPKADDGSVETVLLMSFRLKE